ncbi:laccase-5-like isoform X2 [Senna tora]|uniref:Laccase-5-like isoform X2 n=1 Tax=Senna tora TaxID=362788 RepID=A0A834XFP3_9FABA|nr:laccase-5-like isoform X2 [Senna tora]
MATMQPRHDGNFSASSRVLPQIQNSKGVGIFCLSRTIGLGEWWDANPIDVVREATRIGAAPNVSNAYTINGQLGDLYKCSSKLGANTMIEALEEVKGARLQAYIFFGTAMLLLKDKIAMNITTERRKTL